MGGGEEAGREGSGKKKNTHSVARASGFETALH